MTISDDLRDQISSALSYTAAGADCFALTDAISPVIAAALAEVEAERDLAAEDARRAYIQTADMGERLAVVVRELTPFADGCMGTGEYKLCHDMSEAVENALAAAAGPE